MAASIPLPISISEYLHTSYQPDRDYVDGIVEARNVDGLEHEVARKALIRWIGRRAEQWGIRLLPEARVQTSASHVRVADLALVSDSEEDGDAVETPPVAVIEILCSEDDVERYTERLDDYRRMGVKSVWVVDPAVRKGFDASAPEGGWVETERFTAPESPIAIDLPAIFAEMDEDRVP